MSRKCTFVTRKPTIKLSDSGRKAHYINEKCEKLSVTKYDGCEVVNGTAVDFLIRKKRVYDILIELKGKDVEHALKQVEESLCRMEKNGEAYPIRGAFILCRQYPSGGTQINKRIAKIFKEYRTRVKISSSSYRFSYSDCVW